jgi:tight adherence protein B/tight adherence protein C
LKGVVIIFYGFLLVPVLWFLFYQALREYDIYKLRKEIYRTKTGDELAKIVTKAVRQDILGKIDRDLESAGRPLGLSAPMYVLVRIGLFLFAVLYAYFTGMRGLQALVFAGLGLFGPDIYIRSAKKERMEKFRRELPEIVDLFELGAAAGVPPEDMFLMAAESADSKEVRKALSRLSAEYFLTRDREACLRRFCREAGIPEADVLAAALLQEQRTGRIQDMLSALSSSLFSGEVAKVSKQDRSMEYKVLAAVFLLMASAAVLYMYPYFANIQGGMRLLF